MPQVDFYILDREADSARLTAACRVAEKAMLGDLRVWVRAGDMQEARQLDDLLWTFSQGSFVPHRVVSGTVNTEAVEPVLIATEEPAPADRFDVLINLAPTLPADMTRYRRIAEFIDGNEQRRQSGRERFRLYRDHGCVMGSHNI